MQSSFVLLVIIIFLIIFSIQLTRSLKGIRLMSKGRFTEALFFFKKQHSSRWTPPTVRTTQLFNIANCHAWLGDLEQSLIILNQISEKSLPPALVPSFHFLHVLAHDFLHHPFADYQESFNKIQNEPLSHVSLLVAYIQEKQGNQEAAQSIYESYLAQGSPRQVRLGKVLLWMPSMLQQAQENFFLGHHFLQKGDTQKGQSCLFKSALLPFQNVYSQAAAELLKKDSKL